MGDSKEAAALRFLEKVSDFRLSLEPDERVMLDAIVMGDDAAEVEPHIAEVGKVTRWTEKITIGRNASGDEAYTLRHF